MADEIRATIYRALLEYRMTNMCFEGSIDDGFTLYDLATPHGKTIDSGKAELFKLADFIAAELPAPDTGDTP